MPTPFESAQLLLTLYEQRREETMRKARDFFLWFDPQTMDDFVAAMMSPNGAYVRMVISYWDMAASLVRNGAIDQKMFYDASGEFIGVFAKIEPLLPGIRQMFGNPEAFGNLEWLALQMPNASERLEATRKRLREIKAMRDGAAAKQ